MTEIAFSLGSNMGNRRRLMMQAKNLLLSAPKTRFVAQSPVYETSPVDVAEEHADKQFLNAVLILESGLPLDAWLSYIHGIEARLGRVREENRNAPRTIDIDIIYAGDEVCDREDLELPHARWMDRRFVVQPLADVRPELVLPGMDKSVRSVLTALPQDEEVAVFLKNW